MLQVSDLHLGQAGRGFERAFARLCEFIESLSPRAVIVSGDIAHVPEDAAAFGLVRDGLDALEIPYAAVPGNHDVRAPYPAESLFENFFSETPRVEILGGVETILFDTFRFLRVGDRSREDRSRGRDGHFAHGAITRAQFEVVERKIGPRGKMPRVAVLHHHLHEHRSEVGREEPTKKDREQMRPLYDAEAFLGWCIDHEVDLILTGHQHAWCPPEQFGGVPNVRGTKCLAAHGVVRSINFEEDGSIYVSDHRIHEEEEL